MSERNEGNLPPQIEVHKIGTVTQRLEETDPVIISNIERICLKLREYNLANLVVLENTDDLGNVSRRIRDFSPKIVADSDSNLEDIDTEDFIFARYFSTIVSNSYYDLVNEGETHRESVDKVQFNLDLIIEDFAKRGDTYNAFRGYLSRDDNENAEKLVESVTNNETELVKIRSNPLLSRVMIEDFDKQAAFRTAVFKSDDEKVHSTFTAKLDGFFGKTFIGGMSKEDQAIFWKNYFNPLAEAATLKIQNRFAVADLVKIFRNTFGESFERNITREKFHSIEDYKFFRNVQLEILDVAFSRENEEFEEMLVDYYLELDRNVSSQMGHFLSVLHATKVYGLSYPNLQAWSNYVYPEDSEFGQIVDGIYNAYDMSHAVDFAAGEAINILVLTDAETGPDEQEFLVSKCLSYLDMDLERNRLLISEILKSQYLSDKVREILKSKIESI